MKNLYACLFATFFLFSTSTLLAQSGAWTQKADLPADIDKCAVFSINGKGYVATGNFANFGISDIFWEYDPVSDQWSQKATFPGTPREMAFGFSINGKGYVGGGFDGFNYLNDFWEYDPATDTWAQKTGHEVLKRTQTVAFSIGSKGYFATGNEQNWKSSDTYEYDPATDSWTKKADFPGVSRDQAIGMVINGKAYVGSGIGSSTKPEDWYEYDPATDSWSQVADFPVNDISRGVGASTGDKGFVGIAYISPNNYLNDWYEYDVPNDNWVKRQAFPDQRYEAFGFGINDKIFVGGGSSSVDTLVSFYAFDPDGVSGVEQKEQPAAVSIYPVPAREFVQINFDASSINNGNMEIKDIQGRTLYSAGIEDQVSYVDVSSFPSGLYFLIVRSEAQILNRKSFIITK